MSAAEQPYPDPIPDRIPAPSAPTVPGPPDLSARPIPEHRLLVCDYHLQGPPGAVPRVPSPAADTLAGHLHGWLYHLQGLDPSERRPCDPEQQAAPFAAWLLGDRHPERRPGQVSVRVCWYGEELAHRATAALARNPSAIIGSQPFALAGIAPYSRQPITAASILGREEDARIVRISTISPVTFRNHSRWHCSMDGLTVLRAASSRWVRLWPGTLPEGLEAVHLGAVEQARQLAWLGYVGVVGCELRTEMTRRAPQVETMALRGWVEWDLYGLGKPNRRRLVMALLRGVEVFGLGSRCAYGLGAVRVEVVR